MLLTRSEFAWLYYDTNPQSLPPYDLSPSLMWFLLEGNGAKGLGRALDEYGGKSLGYLDYTCDEQTSARGREHDHGPLQRAPGRAGRRHRAGAALWLC